MKLLSYLAYPDQFECQQIREAERTLCRRCHSLLRHGNYLEFHLRVQFIKKIYVKKSNKNDMINDNNKLP